MSAASWAGDDVPGYFDKRWCPNGHIQRVTDPECPTCKAVVAEAAHELLEALHLGAVSALETDPARYVMTEQQQLDEALDGRR